MNDASESGKILVIRGGAIGDFILTLPALKLLRDGFPSCRIEIMGYRHICALAEGRYYANATRSIEYSAMAGFFNPRAELDSKLSQYFSQFQQIVSYLFDPDEIFTGNLRRCGVEHLLIGSPMITGEVHAARQLARPLESLALFLEDPCAEFFPLDEDHSRANHLMRGWQRPILAIHPGSGSEKKNWPWPYWRRLIGLLAEDTHVGTLLLVGGEGEMARLSALRSEYQTQRRIHVLENLHLCTLGALFSQCDLFVGHDSGISHLAAAAGAKCFLLFGPTNPTVWAPQNAGVEVLVALGGNLEALSVDTVREKIKCFLEEFSENTFLSQ